MISLMLTIFAANVYERHCEMYIGMSISVVAWPQGMRWLSDLQIYLHK